MSPTPLGDASESDALDLDAVAENPDDAWEGLDPSQAVSIEAGGSAVTEITLVDVDTGGLLDRPVGSDGASKPDVGTGDVQLTLTWSSTADLDLAVIEPDGTEIVLRQHGARRPGRPARRRLERRLRARRRASRTSSGRRATPRPALHRRGHRVPGRRVRVG